MPAADSDDDLSLDQLEAMVGAAFEPPHPAAEDAHCKLAHHEIIDRLAARHGGEKWAFFPEVPDGTGALKSRTVDALAMGLQPSVGLDLHGFEVKVSRGDWLKELDRPEKANAFIPYVDFWWLAVGDAEIVKEGELPAGWGLMAPTRNGSRLRIAKRAERLEPTTMDRPFLASLARQVHRALPGKEALKRAFEKGRERGVKDQKSRQNRERRHDEDERLKRAVADFEEVSGLSITGYNGRRLGELVQVAELLTSHDSLDVLLERAAGASLKSARRLKKALRLLRADMKARDPLGPLFGG